MNTEDAEPVRDQPVNDQDPVGSLQRWHAFGAMWRVLELDPGRRVTVGLFRCDGGEEAGRITSDDPELLAFLHGRWSSVD